MPAAGHYPANTYALEHVVNTCSAHGLKSLLEIGVGHGTAIPTLVGAGLDLFGLDRDPEMVATSKQVMAEHDADPDRITLGDIEHPLSYLPTVRQGPFDAALGLGIMPTARHETHTLTNIRSLVRPGGHVFLEYRNVLFSLVTFNRHTRAFLLDDLLAGVDPAMRQAAADFIDPRLDLDVPAPSTSSNPPKYHNPLVVTRDFERLGFTDIETVFFHYHPAPPRLEHADPELFHAEADALEHEDSDWRGMFLCSAFLVHARVGEERPGN